MTAHDWYVENRTAYATRSLDPKEQRLFESHLPRCRECQAAVQQAEVDLAWLPMGVAPVAPPPGLTSRLKERALRRPRPWNRVGALAAAAALAVSVGAWVGAQRNIAKLQSAVVSVEERHRALQDSFTSIVGAERVVHQTIDHTGYRGGVLIFYDDETHWWNVGVHGLPPANVGQVYQLWFVTSDGIMPGPELHPASVRPTFVTFRLEPNARAPIGAKLTLEPVSGPEDRPVGVELAAMNF